MKRSRPRHRAGDVPVEADAEAEDDFAHGRILSEKLAFFQSRPANPATEADLSPERKDCAKVWTWANVRFGARGARPRLEVIVMRSLILATVGTVLMSCGLMGRTRRPDAFVRGLGATELLGAENLFGADSRGRSVHAAANLSLG